MFYVVQAGSTLQAISADGTQKQTLTLPAGVTIDPTVKGQFLIIGTQIIFTRAATINLWIEPTTFTVRPLTITAPVSAPTLAAGTATGLTGDYLAAYSYAVIDADGIILNESGLSPLSNTITVTDQKIDWTGITVSGDAVVNARVLYRTVVGADGEALFQRSIIQDNVTTTLTGDDTPDAALSLLPFFQGNSVPPGGATSGTRLDLSVTWKDRIWAAVKDDIRYTEPNQFYAWPTDNELLASVKGEDQFGVTGFLPRREQLIVGKRNRLLRILGGEALTSQGAAVFEIKEFYFGDAVIAPFSCIVVNDIGYFLGRNGFYRVDDNGVQSMSDDKVDKWFQTDVYFNRASFPIAHTAYNPNTNGIRLYLASPAQLTLNLWVELHIPSGEWFGPHFSSAVLDMQCSGIIEDEDSRQRFVVGGQDSYLYEEQVPLSRSGGAVAADIVVANQDVLGSTPNSPVAISLTAITSFLYPDSPDLFHHYGAPTIITRSEGPAASHLDVFLLAGSLSVPGDGSTAGTVRARASLRRDRSVLPIVGDGRYCKFIFTHSQVGEPMQIMGFTIPWLTIGRRGAYDGG